MKTNSRGREVIGVVGYVRVSTGQQAAEGVSLEAQRARVAAYAASVGLPVLAIHEDAGVSGKRASNRPGLQSALREAVEAPAVLVAVSLSRFARSVSDALTIAERLEKSGGRLVSLSEGFDLATPAGRLLFSVLASVAAFEAELASERTKGVKSHQRARGRYLGARAPYGWQPSPSGDLIPVAGEQATIRAARAARAEGLSLRAVGAALEAAGHRPRTGRAWAAAQVACLLRAAA